LRWNNKECVSFVEEGQNFAVIYRFDAYSLDTETLELKSGTDKITAEPQVFHLLQYLIENRARVVSKDDIFNAVWDGRIVSDSAIAYTVREARRLVGDDGSAQSVIRTLPRRGFRFVAEVNEESMSVRQLSSLEELPVPSDKPSIAVLPFDNLSGDPEQEYFADGIAEDIITGLSKFHWFFVIARNSSFSYKGTTPDVRQVAKELGVQYVLEGSVRKVGNRIRITAQLVDALTGRHVWAERYDSNLDDIFAVQDEISEAITAMVAPAFLSAEALRTERKAPENFDAWDYAMRGNWYLARRGKNDLAEAQRLFEAALDLDPKSTMALSGLAHTLGFVIILGWADDGEDTIKAAYSAARRAVDLDESDAWAHTALGFVSFFTQQLDNAITECQRALELNPNLALAETVLSVAYSWRGDDEDALLHADKATRLSPRDPHFLGRMAHARAEFGAGNYEQAAMWAKKTTEASPEFPGGWRYLMSSLAHLGRLEEARAAKDQLLHVSPRDSINAMRAISRAAEPERMERFFDGLRKAGLPEAS
jgi:TolB-like protein